MYLAFSGDIDVIIALLYHILRFHEHSTDELWHRAGVEDTTQYFTLYVVYSRLGTRLCVVLPAAQGLTGGGITSY